LRSLTRTEHSIRLSIADIGFRHRFADRNLCTGLIRLHVLHHAAEGPIYGQAMIDELSRHGYRLSAGTLYPILHGVSARAAAIPVDAPTAHALAQVRQAAVESARAQEEQLARTLLAQAQDAVARVDVWRALAEAVAYGDVTLLTGVAGSPDGAR
jgi:hypothetical protein